MTNLTADQFRSLTGATTFVATRAVRGAVHENGTIEQDAEVMFCRQEPQDGNGWYLAYISGEPTNGNQYRVFSDWQSVRAFVEGTGLSTLEGR